jgi:hypothetical protein
MSTQNPGSGGLREITVTCNSCGSTSMQRLDRREYKCTNCGSITVVSDDDASELEAVLGKFLGNADLRGQPRVWSTTHVEITPSPNPTPQTGRAVATGKAGFPFALVWFIGLVVLYLVAFNSSPPNNVVATPKVPAKALTLTQRQGMGGAEFGVLTNTSQQPIDLPPMTMTSYNGDFKIGTTPGTVAVDHLLPNEHAIAVFAAAAGSEATRFDFTVAENDIPVSSATVIPMQLMQQKLLHVVQSNRYQLVGVVQNPSARPLARGKITVTLYDADHKIIGWGGGLIRALDPAEKAAISVDLEMSEGRGEIASYDYLIDVTPT